MSNRKGVPAVALGLWALASGTGQAVNLAMGGTGEALIFPHYSVNGGFQTLVSVVNTTDRVKAVKLAFRESMNGRRAISFNLYLAPYDVWTATLFDEDGPDSTSDPAVLLTEDPSCTVPEIFNSPIHVDGVDLFTLGFSGPRNDGGPEDPFRTREGYIEMIEMGEIGDTVSGSATAATHSDGEPNDCRQLLDAWTALTDGTPAPGAYWLVDPTVDLLPPGGGLRGAASLVDALDGIQVSYPAIALEAFWQPDALAIHSEPQVFPIPNLTSASFDPDQDGRVNSVVIDRGRVIESDWAVPIDAVSAVLMQDVLLNEYVFEETLDARTDWVVVLPTKPYYTDPEMAAGGFEQVPVAPFENAIDFPAGASESVPLVRYQDRHSTQPSDPDGCLFPSPPGCPPSAQLSTDSTLPFVGQTLSFVRADLLDPEQPVGHYPTITQSLNSVAFPSFGFQSGWARFNLWADDSQGSVEPEAIRHQLDGAQLIGGTPREQDGDLYRGLPVVGFAITVLKNGTLVDDDGSSTLANYAGLTAHGGRYGIEQPSAPEPVTRLQQ